MVRLGAHLRELSRRRAVLIAAAAVASFVAFLSICSVSLAPPALSLRSSEPAGAHTQILVDGPRPGILSTATGLTSYDWLDNGALLLGDVMTSDPGDDYIARAAGISPANITFGDPQSYIQPSSEPGTSGTPQYTLTVAASPSVPLLDVYVTGPTEAGAMRLVNAAYGGLRDYLDGPGSTGTFQLRITQLGHGRRVAAGGGSPLTGALVRFSLVFVLCAELGLLVRRSMQAWQQKRTAWIALSNRGSRAASGSLIK